MSGSVIPSILQSSAVEESQSIRVETVLLDADVHNFVAGQYGRTRFVLPKRGTVLSPDGRLVWKAAYAGLVGDNSAAYPRDGGGHVAVSQCWLYMDGKLLSHTDQCGTKAYIDSKFLPWDHQTEVGDVLEGGNRKYAYSQATARGGPAAGGQPGCLEWQTDQRSNMRGTRCIVAGIAGQSCLECALHLKHLFPLLKDTLIPMSLRGELSIEIEWEGQSLNTIVEGGTNAYNAGAPWGSAATRAAGYSVIEPRLVLDYISYAPDIDAALREQVASGAGMVVPFREAVLVRSQLPALAAGGQQNDLELGFAGRSVMKLYVQKLQAAGNVASNAVFYTGGGGPVGSVVQQAMNQAKKNLRSDGLQNEAIQLVVNNKSMYDRVVTQPSEMYSYLCQTAEAPFFTEPGSYGQIGRLTTPNLVAGNSFAQQIASTSGQVSQVAAGALNVPAILQDELYQGRSRWLGFNLAQSRGGADTPSNAVKIGASPIILRLNRDVGALGTARDQTFNDVRTQSAVNVNTWVEAVSQMIMRNGRVEIMAA